LLITAPQYAESTIAEQAAYKSEQFASTICIKTVITVDHLGKFKKDALKKNFLKKMVSTCCLLGFFFR